MEKKEYSMDELREMEYEDLAHMWSDKEITSLQFVEALSENYYSDWEEWLQDNHRERDEQAAEDYMDWFEEEIEKYAYADGPSFWNLDDLDKSSEN